MKNLIFKRILFLLALAMIMSCFTGTSAYAAVVKGELIRNNTFDSGVGLPWQVYETYPAKADFDIKDGKYIITIKNRGERRWDTQFRYRNLVIEKGHTYTVKFTVSATKDCMIYTKIGDMGEPYTEYWNYKKNWEFIQLKANVPQTITDTFTMTSNTAEKCELSFHLGDDRNQVPYTISFDDIYLSDPEYVRIIDDHEKPTNGIRVNQEGYIPGMAKIATLVSNSAAPVEWKLLDDSGAAVAKGYSEVKGFDKSSGDNVHIIDFSSYTTKGNGYRLIAGDIKSLAFDIRTNLYSTLKYDALKYFYLNRSGIDIVMPYAGNSQYSRIAKHPKDTLYCNPNNGYKGNYSLDVTGGWYDEDYNVKSPVHSGVATWTLMNEFEHALYNGNTAIAPYADNTMNIPESGNGHPDILDEARFNLETLLRMQVPEDKAYCGMAHHGVAAVRSLSGYLTGTLSYERFLESPTTVATLNLSALAAQGARLWEKYDTVFAAKCLKAAEAAWDAAVVRPDMYAYYETIGGGTNLKDDFYWAACELYVTTGKAKYLNYIQSSEHYLEEPSEDPHFYEYGYSGCFDWGNTAGLGTITLALVPNGLPAVDVAKARSNIIAAADKFIAVGNSQGYGVPIKESKLNDVLEGFPYQSNTFVLNEAIVMAYAHDFSKGNGTSNSKYINGVSSAMDYILGRNPKVQSYITGYGESPLENPHHSLWSYDGIKAPAGCLSSGPNSGLQDPYIKGAGWTPGKIAPEKCFIDARDSWSTNDVGISSNAPLAWVSAYLDDNGPQIVPPTSIYGDVNGDKVIDALDLGLVKKFLLAPDSVLINKAVADVNADGSINAMDYALIKKYLLGKIAEFPAGVKVLD